MAKKKAVKRTKLSKQTPDLALTGVKSKDVKSAAQLVAECISGVRVSVERASSRLIGISDAVSFCENQSTMRVVEVDDGRVFVGAAKIVCPGYVELCDAIQVFNLDGVQNLFDLARFGPVSGKTVLSQPVPRVICKFKCVVDATEAARAGFRVGGVV